MSIKVKVVLYTVLIITAILIVLGIIATFNPESVSGYNSIQDY